LLFASTQFGDLTAFISDYFDTNVGAKKEIESYKHIGGALELRPSEVVFVSDVIAELDAAASSGFQTILCVRPGNHPQKASSEHMVIRSFDEILP
jgi:enolase-phosphatase E1